MYLCDKQIGAWHNTIKCLLFLANILTGWYLFWCTTLCLWAVVSANSTVCCWLVCACVLDLVASLHPQKFNFKHTRRLPSRQHALSYVYSYTYLLCRHDERWHPVWPQPDWSGHGASCGGQVGLSLWGYLAGAEGPFPSRNTPWFGHSASSWPAAGAGQWGETPADTGLSPCSDETHYIAGNNLTGEKGTRAIKVT